MTSKLEEALNIAYSCYKDKGNSYIKPLSRSVLRNDSDEDKIVAVLHSVLEDTDCSMRSLKEKIILPSILWIAIEAITRMENETYFDYIQRVKSNVIARRIKINDLVYYLTEKKISVNLRHQYYEALTILCEDGKLPKDIKRIGEFYGMKVYIDRILPEVEYLEVNYQDEVCLHFLLIQERFEEVGDYAFVVPVFMEWYQEFKEQIFEMIEQDFYYLLPDWEI